MSGFRHVGEHEVHAGRVWRVVVAEFESPDGDRFERDIVRSPGAVAVLPLQTDGDGTHWVTLVEQYRPAHDRTVIEIPAGMRDVTDEPTDATARRELIEEAGLRAGDLEHLVDMSPSVGMTDSVCTIYLATGCERTARDLHGPEESHMSVHECTLDDALAMVDDGRIHDAKTVVALLACERRLRRRHGS